jgi:hypothetical protein
MYRYAEQAHRPIKPISTSAQSRPGLPYITVMSNALELYAIIRLLSVNLPELHEVHGVGGKEIPFIVLWRTDRAYIAIISCSTL